MVTQIISQFLLRSALWVPIKNVPLRNSSGASRGRTTELQTCHMIRTVRITCISDTDFRGFLSNTATLRFDTDFN